MENTLIQRSMLSGIWWIDGDNRVCYNTLENAVCVRSMVQYHRAYIV